MPFCLVIMMAKFHTLPISKFDDQDTFKTTKLVKNSGELERQFKGLSLPSSPREKQVGRVFLHWQVANLAGSFPQHYLMLLQAHHELSLSAESEQALTTNRYPILSPTSNTHEYIKTKPYQVCQVPLGVITMKWAKSITVHTVCCHQTKTKKIQEDSTRKIKT